MDNKDQLVSISEKGKKTVKAAVRTAFKANVIENLEIGSLELVENDKGEIYTALAVDPVTGETVYARISIVITANDPA